MDPDPISDQKTMDPDPISGLKNDESGSYIRPEKRWIRIQIINISRRFTDLLNCKKTI